MVNRAVSSVGVEVAVTLLEVTVAPRSGSFTDGLCSQRDMTLPMPSGDVRLRIIAVDAAANINTAMNNPVRPRKGSPHNKTMRSEILQPAARLLNNRKIWHLRFEKSFVFC